MKVQSKTYPEITRSKKERIVRVPHNIDEIIVDEETIYQYGEQIYPDDGHDIADTDYWNARAAESDSLLESAKDLVISLTYDQIDNHIDTVFSSLAVDQKASLKKLYKAVLYLLKR